MSHNLAERLPESQIIEFLEADDEYTVEIDLLIELAVYSRKDHAVSALKRNFIQGIDFSRTTGKTPGGGRPSDSYFLTSQCFRQMCQLAETEMGQLVRDYYITIEKRWKENRKNQITAATNDAMMAQLMAQSQQMLLQTQQMMLQIAAIAQQQGVQIAVIDSRVAQIEATQQEAIASLDEASAPEVEPEILTTRAKLNRLVRDYSGANAMHFQEVWRRVYREFKDRYHVDLKQRAKNIQASGGKKFGALDVCEQLSMIEELYAVAFEILKA